MIELSTDPSVTPRVDRSIQIASGYVVIAALWIIVTDLIVARGQIDRVAQESIAKGLGFVFVTGSGLLWLLFRNAHRLAEVDEERTADMATETFCSALDEALLARHSLDGALVQLCQSYADLYGASAMWIGIRLKEEIVVRAAVGPKAPQYTAAVVNAWLNPSLADQPTNSTCPELVALRRRRPVIARPLKGDPWGDEVLRENIGTVVVIPVADNEFDGFVSLAHPANPPHHILITLLKAADRITRAFGHGESLRTQRRLVAAMTAAADAVYICDGEARVVWVNDAFERLTGYTAAEVIGASPGLLAVSKDEAYEHLAHVRRTGKAWMGVYEGRRKDESIYRTNETIRPVTDNGNVVTEFVIVLDHELQPDITLD